MKGSPCLYRLVKMRSSSAIPPKLVRSAGGAGAEAGPVEAAEAEAEKEEVEDEVEEEEVDESDDDAVLLFPFCFVFFRCKEGRLGSKASARVFIASSFVLSQVEGTRIGRRRERKRAREKKKSTRAKEEKKKRRRSWRRHLQCFPCSTQENLGLLVFFSNSDPATR